MKVRLCYTTDFTPKGKMFVKEFDSMKSAKGFYDFLSLEITKAYIDHFDGWHYRLVKRLKGY
jgi:hypothetical protein